MEKNELFSEIDKTMVQLLNQMSYVDEDKINTVPYRGSWTAAQLLRHVSKATFGMARAMTAPQKDPGREPDTRVPELQNTFLNLVTKMHSPEFLVPEAEAYEKESSMQEVKQAFHRLKNNANNTDLNSLVEGLSLGPITKLEILYFSLYHTQRHLQQMKEIVDAL